jgi:Ran GTPase-activating protein (RanGAP) involved in mRNA processing and transport
MGRNDMPNLKQLELGNCKIDDDGLVTLVSALEQNTALHILDFGYNCFGERGLMALAENLPIIKGLQQITFAGDGSFLIDPAIVDGGLSKEH